MNQGKDSRKAELRMIPLDRIEVLNPRERNGRVSDADIDGNRNKPWRHGTAVCV